MKKALSILLIISLMSCFLTGCDNGTHNQEAEDTSAEEIADSSSSEATAIDPSQTNVEQFSDRDLNCDYSTEDSILISLNGSFAECDSESVKISGSTVTISEEATYILSGTLDNGSLIVDADENDKLQIVLNGASITSLTSAALYINEADKVFLTLADGTENTLSNGGSFTDESDSSIDGAVFSRQDLTLNGKGSLTVTAPAGHGIVCKDDLVITDGSYTVSCASHGLNANDSIRITNAALSVDAGKDALHCENSEDDSSGYIYVLNGSITLEAEGDGFSSSSYTQIEGGSFELLCGGGSENGSKSVSDGYGGFMGGNMRPPHMTDTAVSEYEESGTSMKGIKAANNLLINGGSFIINSADDSIHSDMSVSINGGTYDLASGDDAIHAEDKLTVSTADISITESYEGLEALHIEIQGGDISIVSTDDGLNAAGGADSSGTTGGRDGMHGGAPNGSGMGGPDGMGAATSQGNGSILISGGNIDIVASGDGIDSNGTLTITGGFTVVTGPTHGDTATLDYDKSATISGGTFIGTGAYGMAQSFSDSEQGVVAVSVGNQNADTNITLTDKNGNTLISYAPTLPFAVVILSSPEIISGETYTITVGSVSGEFEAN